MGEIISVRGKYSDAVIYTTVVDEGAVAQLQRLCDHQFTEGCKIRVMPDVHAGAGCVIGFTADLGELVIPNIVGVDIGCGMLTVELGNVEIDFAELDEIIRTWVPSGFAVHEGRKVRFDELQQLYCYRNLKDSRRLERSLGTLGGGNHFIEVDTDEEGEKYLVIHTGSRNLGKQVAEHYQSMAYDVCRGADGLFEAQKALIERYKAEGRAKELQGAIAALKAKFRLSETLIPKELCYLTGEYRQMYLHDMRLCQEFATLNRKLIADIILQKLQGRTLAETEHFETVHNYIDMESNIVRKGAVSAKAGEKLLIPINMRDGSLICVGKGNSEWNCSAPHGAGRLFSRTSAKDRFSVDEFKASMEGIFSTSVGADTLDESPMAYKRMEDIVDNIEDTAEIVKVIRPLYNFKAGEQETPWAKKAIAAAERGARNVREERESRESKGL